MIREKSLRANLKKPHTASEEAVILSELNEISRGRNAALSSAGKLDSEISEDEKEERDKFISKRKEYQSNKKIVKEMESLIKNQRKQL